MQLVDEEDDVLGAANLVHHRLDALFELAAVFRAGDHQREIERDDLLVAQQFRHIAARDFLREAFDDRGLAHAGFADQHRIVLGAAAEHLDDALDFVLAADDRIELAFLGQLGQVAAKRRSAGVLTSFLPQPALSAASPPASASGGVKFGSSSFRISLRVRSISTSRLFSTRAATPSPSRSKAEQNVLGADVGMIERLRFLAGEREHFLHARRVGNVADHLRLRAGADLFLDFHADGFEIEPHLLEHVDGDALAELDQAEQKMLGADVIVVEAIGFLASERQDLLGARSEIVHCSYGPAVEPLPDSRRHLTNIRFGEALSNAPG